MDPARKPTVLSLLSHHHSMQGASAQQLCNNGLPCWRCASPKPRFIGPLRFRALACTCRHWVGLLPLRLQQAAAGRFVPLHLVLRGLAPPAVAPVRPDLAGTPQCSPPGSGLNVFTKFVCGAIAPPTVPHIIQRLGAACSTCDA